MWIWLCGIAIVDPGNSGVNDTAVTRDVGVINTVQAINTISR
jgi:hypothetical protein